MRKVIVVNVFIIDTAAVDRAPTGEPRISGETFDYQLFMATPSGDGFALETWHPGTPPRQDVDMIPDLAHLVSRIATALAAEDV